MHILVCDDDAVFAAQMDEVHLGMVPRPGDPVPGTVCTSGELLATPELPSCLEDIFAGMTDSKKTLEVHHNRTTSEIPLDQIYYLESDLRQINVYGDIPHQPICTFYGKIADLPAMLYENGFLQVGRSDVVNLQYVRSIRNYKVELRSGVELNASRQDFAAIRSAWLEWKGQFGDE